MAHAFFGKMDLKRMRKSDPAYTIRPDSGCTLAVMAIIGRNQNASGSDPACLLGDDSYNTDDEEEEGDEVSKRSPRVPDSKST